MHLTRPETDPVAPPSCAHVVHFYADHGALIDRLVDYVSDAVAARETCILVTTPAHRVALQARLTAAGTEPRPGQVVQLDAAETLQGFMRSGRPDPALFDATVGSLVRSTTATRGPLRAYGEMVAVLWAYGNAVGALELEELWNDLQATVQFPLLCAYPSADQRLREGDALMDICARHTERSWY